MYLHDLLARSGQQTIISAAVCPGCVYQVIELQCSAVVIQSLMRHIGLYTDYYNPSRYGWLIYDQITSSSERVLHFEVPYSVKYLAFYNAPAIHVHATHCETFHVSCSLLSCPVLSCPVLSHEGIHVTVLGYAIKS